MPRNGIAHHMKVYINIIEIAKLFSKVSILLLYSYSKG